MSQKCANPKCNKEVKSTPGKRPKKYCSPRCTSAHWQALHYEPKKKSKNMIELPADFINCEKIGIIRADGTIDKVFNFINGILIESGEYPSEGDFKAQEAPKTKKQYNLPPKEESVKGEAENGVKIDNSGTLRRIKELEAELKSPPKNPMIGLKNWVAVRENEIKELKRNV